MVAVFAPKFTVMHLGITGKGARIVAAIKAAFQGDSGYDVSKVSNVNGAVEFVGW